jgi:hypothetical protein
MAEQELTILRALNEVSLLNKKIEKALSNRSAYLHFSIGKKAPVGFKTIAEVEESIKSQYQKVTALLKRRTDIKSAIVASNAKTTVTINGETITVAAAIERKQSIGFDNKLLSNLVNSSAQVNRKIESHNAEVDRSVESLVAQAFGSKNAKITKEEHDAIAIPFKESRTAESIDPIGIKNEIDKLEDSINEFERNIDNVLTESNAVTKITVSD